MDYSNSLCVRNTQLTVRARVCACMELYRGADMRLVAATVGIALGSLSKCIMPELVRSGLVGRTRRGNARLYHSTKLGRRLVRSELAALRLRDLETLRLVRDSGRGRLDLLEELEGKLKGE